MSIVVGISNIFLVLFPRFLMNYCWYKNKPQYSVFNVLEDEGRGIIMGAPHPLPAKECFLEKSRCGTPLMMPCPRFWLKYQMLYPQEAASGSKLDQKSIFISEMIVYFRPTCAGWPCIFLKKHTLILTKNKFSQLPFGNLKTIDSKTKMATN